MCVFLVESKLLLVSFIDSREEKLFAKSLVTYQLPQDTLIYSSKEITYGKAVVIRVYT